MVCAELQDRLWEAGDSEDVRAHLDHCPVCARAQSDIARIREGLRLPPASADRFMPGILARMARPSPQGWSRMGRYAAGLLIGILAGLALRPAPTREIQTVIVHKEAPAPALHRLLARFEKDPDFEEMFVAVLNETLRRRSRPEVLVKRDSEVMR